MPDKNRADNSRDRDRGREEELKESFLMHLTNEEGMLLLTSARLLDKLVAGVTIHAQERDQLIKDIIEKLDQKVPPEVSRVANELADAIVDSVLCEGEMEDDYGMLSESLNFSGEDDLTSIRYELGADLESYSLDDALTSKQKFVRDMASDATLFDFPMYKTDHTLPVLEKALINHHSVQAHYYSFARESVDSVTLDPLVIMKEQNLWRMVAYCHERHEVLIFRVDRIKEIMQTLTSFEAPGDIAKLSYSRLPVYS